jgi:hypothetical protein
LRGTLVSGIYKNNLRKALTPAGGQSLMPAKTRVASPDCWLRADDGRAPFQTWAAV